MNNNIDKSKVKFLSLSVDKTGRIFFYKNRIFRAIYKESLYDVRKLFHSGLIEELINKNLIPKVWKTNFNLDGYALILEHEKISYWNYPYEWSFGMVKDAALLVLKINKIINKYNYELHDPHAHNVVFDGMKPKYVDLGSFAYTKDTKSWTGFSIFYKDFYIPLVIWSKGYTDIARNIYLMTDYFNEEEFYRFNNCILRFIGFKFSHKFISFICKVKKLHSADIDKLKYIIKTRHIKINNKFIIRTISVIKMFLASKYSISSLSKKINKLVSPVKVSMWSDYQQDMEINNNERFLRIADIINGLGGGG